MTAHSLALVGVRLLAILTGLLAIRFVTWNMALSPEALGQPSESLMEFRQLIVNWLLPVSLFLASGLWLWFDSPRIARAVARSCDESASDIKPPAVLAVLLCAVGVWLAVGSFTELAANSWVLAFSSQFGVPPYEGWGAVLNVAWGALIGAALKLPCGVLLVVFSAQLSSRVWRFVSSRGDR